jgi:hypothetical protein
MAENRSANVEEVLEKIKILIDKNCEISDEDRDILSKECEKIPDGDKFFEVFEEEFPKTNFFESVQDPKNQSVSNINNNLS